ncbi:S9 family peptidase [Steroidobacter sp.]|uniref:S9 family peptidase n=1 Tax=Steroidobacter sp. TaxID=1978227 RepID=UPI001A51047D|nr:prolyl oligopeptidase family serine peptidase [Steroidobacter sp.]MBL8267280.1 prolyl oligopeptidase family serine peptidase [Steroidobacter sp.]
MKMTRDLLRCLVMWTVAAHGMADAGAGEGADNWTTGFERAEAFIQPQVGKLLPRDVSAAALNVKWAEDESWLEWTADGKRQRMELASGKVTSVETGGAASKAGPSDRVSSRDGRFQIYAKDHNLFVTDAAGTRQLTDDGELWRTFDAGYADSNPQSRPVYAGSPPLVHFLGDSSWFVAERWDYREVSPVWLANSIATPRPASIEQRRAYPGDKNIPTAELWLIDAASGTRRAINNEGWAYVGNMDVASGGIFPSPDGRSLYFVRMQRQYEVVELCRVAVPNGEIEVIWREQRDSHFTVRDPELVFVGQGEQLIWKSDRDGRVHYYLLDARRKKLIRQLTSGDFAVNQVLHVDAAKREFFFDAYGDGQGGDPYYMHVFRGSLNGGSPRRLDTEPATHSFTPSSSAKYFIDTFSTVETAPRTVLRDRNGRIVKELAVAKTDSLRAAGWQAPERYKVKAADDATDLYGVLWKPFDFDPKRRYPVVAVVYPGPSGDSVPTRFSPSHNNAALAQLGFIVIAPGTRGSASSRGVAFQTYARTSGNIRDYTLPDLRKSIESLAASRPWMDVARVGVVGHSGGGFMTLAAMLHDPDFYKVGVASAGNHDNNIYEMNSGEFYWGDPRTGPTGGPRGYVTNMDEVQRLKGALLLIHGETDSDVPVASTLRVVDALVHANKVFDLLILPGKDHSIRYQEPTADSYVRRRTWKYLSEHLLGTGATK